MNQSVIQNAIAGLMTKAVATGLFVSLCTIKAPPSNAITASGGQAPLSAYVAVSGLSSIPCMDAPIAEATLQATEVKALEEIVSKSIRHVLLDDFYSLLSPSTNWGSVGWIAQITGPDGTVVTYDLMGAECDSQQTMTRLKLQLVSL